ncbi:MAG: glycosyltransferase family 4 protein [Candidatus Paceibacterota bacterium]|jgi:glycosyltransferase involved in cell wall biosynthesis
MTRILILGDYPLPNETITGGIMRSVYLTANALSKLCPEYDFHVLTITDGIDKSFVSINKNLAIHYIHFPLRNKPILVPKFLSKQLILHEINKIKPDLIHANGSSWEYGYPAIAYKKCPVLITVHGVSHNESKYWSGLKGAWHRISCCKMESHIFEKMENVVAVSYYVEREMRKCISKTQYGNYAIHVDVISNPVDPCFMDVTTKYTIPNLLLYVGGIEKRKGLDVLIRSLYIVKKQMPYIKLNVVGSIRSPIYCADIMKLISDLDLIDNVNFVGKVSDTLLMKEYSNASIYISPSYEESEGITILEAMATGTPVIATRSGGSESIIKDGVDGLLVKNGNHEELAFKILICGDALKEQLGKGGRETALKYLPENIAKQYMEVYRRLLKCQN